LLCRKTSTLVLGSHIAFVHCSTKSVKVDEKGLREVGLNTPALVVNIVVSGIVGEDPVDRVVGESVTTVVEDRLDGRAGEEPHGLAHR
jgi:hypothetical protein